MAEYIDKENALLQLTGRFPHSMSLEKYIGLVNFRLNGLDAANVVERSKIDKSIAEIKDGYYGNEEKSETDSERADAFNNGLSYALEILKRNIGE